MKLLRQLPLIFTVFKYQSTQTILLSFSLGFIPGFVQELQLLSGRVLIYIDKTKPASIQRVSPAVVFQGERTIKLYINYMGMLLVHVQFSRIQRPVQTTQYFNSNPKTGATEPAIPPMNFPKASTKRIKKKKRLSIANAFVSLDTRNLLGTLKQKTWSNQCCSKICKCCLNLPLQKVSLKVTRTIQATRWLFLSTILQFIEECN